MDVVLLKPVEKLGAAGEVVHVKPGFARNYLIPCGLAAPATPQQLNALTARKRHEAQQAERAQTEAAALKEQLERAPLALSLSVGADEKPFGSITVHDVVEALTRQGIAVEKSMVRLEHPIKVLGRHEIPVRLHPQVTATVVLSVVKA